MVLLDKPGAITVMSGLHFSLAPDLAPEHDEKPLRLARRLGPERHPRQSRGPDTAGTLFNRPGPESRSWNALSRADSCFKLTRAARPGEPLQRQGSQAVRRLPG